MADTPLLIAGLGNPGETYARHRHNAGFMAVDVIHESYEFGPWRRRFEGAFSEGTLKGRKAYLLKPHTFMNVSGNSVGAAARFFKLDSDAVVVMHDELDLAVGKLKVKTGGGDAGHNGLRSITATLGPNYRRVRIGVGHPGSKERVHGHVLDNFSKADETWLIPLLSAIAEAAPLLAADDDVGFMNKVALLTQPPREPKTPKEKPPKTPKEDDNDGI
jgi:PTH1 family peptidyl-tRNA hydrolase